MYLTLTIAFLLKYLPSVLDLILLLYSSTNVHQYQNNVTSRFFYNGNFQCVFDAKHYLRQSEVDKTYYINDNSVVFTSVLPLIAARTRAAPAQYSLLLCSSLHCLPSALFCRVECTTFCLFSVIKHITSLFVLLT